MKWKAPTAYGDSAVGPMRKPKRRLNSPSSSSISDESEDLALYYFRSQKTLPPLTQQPSSPLPPLQQYLVYPNTTPRTLRAFVDTNPNDELAQQQEEKLLEHARLVYSPPRSSSSRQRHTRSMTPSESTRAGKRTARERPRGSEAEEEEQDEVPQNRIRPNSSSKRHERSSAAQELLKAQEQAAQAELDQALLLQQKAAHQLEHEQQKRIQKQEEQKDYRQYMYYATKYGPLDALLYCCTNRPGKIYAILIDRSIRRIQKWAQERMSALRKFYICFLAQQNVGLFIEQGLANVVHQHFQQQKALSFWQRLRLRAVHQCFVQWYFIIQQNIKAKQICQRVLHHEVHGCFILWYDHVQARKEIRQANLTRVSKRLFQRIVLRCLQAWIQLHTKNKRVQSFFKAKLHQRAKKTFDCWHQTIQLQRKQRQASIKIQAHVRGFVKRRQYKRYLIAALVLSRMIRGFLGRRRVKRIRHQFEFIANQLKLERLQLKTQELSQHQSTRRLFFDQEKKRRQEENQLVAKNQKEMKEEVFKSLGKVLSNEYRRKLAEKIKYYKTFTTTEERKEEEEEEPKRLSTKEATEKATNELIEEAQYDAAMKTRRLFRQQNPPLFQCNHILLEKDYHGTNLICLGTFSHDFFMEGHSCYGYTIDTSFSDKEEEKENRRMLLQLETIEEKERQQLEVFLEVPFEISKLWKRLSQLPLPFSETC